jgi:zinc D-Ala-D-Ala carboxypeptidase
VTDQLTAHFSLSELTRSEYAIRHGIDNTPGPDVLASLLVLADGLERVRSILSMPMVIQSAYRSPKVNAGIGGARNSQHITGNAADFVVVGMDLREACQMIMDHEDLIQWDQLILEGEWIHVSFVNDRPARGDILTAHFGSGPATYSRGIA